jgi:phage tail sheath protein FI
MDIVEKDNLNNDIKYTTERPHVSNTVTNFKNRALDNNFAAAYFPDVTMQDPNTRTNLVVPPSVVVLGAMALNDRLGHPWFAPAGFTRGAIGNRAIEAKVRLNQADMDVLYDANINPIAAFDGSGGPVVWGQKTLQTAASALDRVNVRRLLIEIRRQVRDIAQTILFEPNRAATLARFTAAVTPRLQRIQAQAGLERFRVIVDSSTTTQQDIENNTVRGKIFVQPTKSIEFVSLDFVVANGLQAE